MVHSRSWLPAPSLIFFLVPISPTQHGANLTIRSPLWPESDFPDLTSQGQPDQAQGWTKSLGAPGCFGGLSLPQRMNLLNQEVRTPKCSQEQDLVLFPDPRQDTQGTRGRVND